MGGIELLLALGFQARLQAPEPASTVGAADSKAPSPAQLNVLEATVQDIRSRPFADLSTGHHVGDFATGVVRYAACVFPLLAPHTTWEMHLEMQEPSIDTLTSSASAEGVAVKVSWLDWFDSLNAYKVLVEEAIQKCV